MRTQAQIRGRYLLSSLGKDKLVPVASSRDQAPTLFDPRPRRVAGVRLSERHPILFAVTAQLATLLQDALGSAYRLERELEAGGMSRLFLATDVKLNRQVVVKVLPPDLVSTTSIARFKREIELTVRLQHPHILPIITSGSYDDVLYYITPYIPGESLRERIEREGKLPLEDILKILREVGGALVFAHQRGIAHRDIKPGNILIAEGHAILSDFGIARAVSTTATPLTDSGVMPGTPAYMAPELPTDERADLYAFGIVAEEMLLGERPARRVNARQLIALRGRIRGDSRVRLARLAKLIGLSLSQQPAERPPTARELLQRLEEVSAPQTRSIAIVGAIVLVIALVAYSVFKSIPTTLSKTTYAVALLSAPDSFGNSVRDRLVDRFADWRGINVVDVGGGRATNTPQQASIENLMAAARRAGAANLVAVDLTRDHDSVRVRVTLHDVVGDSVTRTRRATFSVRVESGAQSMSYRRLVSDLLRDGEELPWRSVSDSSSASLTAWREYDRGRAFVKMWRLAPAAEAFRNSIEADASIGVAHLWLARVLAWADTSSRSQVRTEAARALAERTRLNATDVTHAEALLAFGDGDAATACPLFHRLATADSTDFQAWIGLGDCQARDRLVVRNSKTLTGFAFRSSFEGAARSYARAAQLLELNAGSEFYGWLLGRLSMVLFSTTNRVRTGYSRDRDSVFFGAFQYLDHDSVAFAPHPMRDFASRTGDPPIRLIEAAALRNRNALRASAENWVRRFPADPAAYDSVARWSELSGGYATIAGRQTPTVELLERARVLSRDSVQRLRLAIAEVRVLVKESRFDRAQALADSLRRFGIERHNRDVAGVVGITALLGHLHDAIPLIPLSQSDHRVQLPDGRLWMPPRPISEAAASLMAYAAFGAAAETVHVHARETSQLIHSYVPDSLEADRIESVLVTRPLLYLPAHDLTPDEFRPESPNEIARAVFAVARGDTAEGRRRLQRLEAVERGKSPGNDIRAAIPVAQTWLALRDTGEAIRRLDAVLRTLPALDIGLLTDVEEPALLVRTLALRAELADRLGDSSSALSYANAVLVLWKNADRTLSPLLQSMRTIQSRRKTSNSN
jgi:serine/threonine-protein kinase